MSMSMLLRDLAHQRRRLGAALLVLRQTPSPFADLPCRCGRATGPSPPLAEEPARRSCRRAPRRRRAVRLRLGRSHGRRRRGMSVRKRLPDRRRAPRLRSNRRHDAVDGNRFALLTLISASTPAAGDGISASTLSVEISNSGSSRSTASPTFLIQRTIVPSAIDSPICGISTGVDIGDPCRLQASGLPAAVPSRRAPLAIERSHANSSIPPIASRLPPRGRRSAGTRLRAAGCTARSCRATRARVTGASRYSNASSAIVARSRRRCRRCGAPRGG